MKKNKRNLIIICIIAILTMALSGCAKSIEEQIQEQLELGNQYLLEMDYENAIVAFEKVIELEDKNVEAHLALGQAYEGIADQMLETDRATALEQYAQAAACYEQALELDSGQKEAYEHLVDIYPLMGQPEKLLDLPERFQPQSGSTVEAEKELEMFRNCHDIAEELTEACKAEDYDQAAALMQDDRFQDMKDFLSSLENPVYMVDEDTGMGIYPANSPVFREDMLYYGTYEEQKREGSGVLINYNDLGTYHASGQWKDGQMVGSLTEWMNGESYDSSAVDVKYYLKDWKPLRQILNFTKEKGFDGHTELYEDNGYTVEDFGNYDAPGTYETVSDYIMRNDGNPNVTFYGIKPGDSFEEADEALRENGWVLYFQREMEGNEEYTYIAVKDHLEYQAWITADVTGQVIGWSISNWTEEWYIWDDFARIENNDPTVQREDWQRIYINYALDLTETEVEESLNNPYGDHGETGYSLYQLVYLDEDEIPELYVDHVYGSAGAEMLSIQNGELRSQLVSSLGHGMAYIERSGLMYNTSGNMDHYYDNIYVLRDGSFITLGEGEYTAYDENGNLRRDANGMNIYTYYWDGTMVSEEEYSSRFSSLFDESDAVWFLYEEMSDSIGIVNEIAGFYE